FPPLHSLGLGSILPASYSRLSCFSWMSRPRPVEAGMHLPARRLPCWTALCFVAALAQAANTSALKGKVTDGKGQTLPGATLVLRNASLALPERGLVTDAE